MILKGGRAKQQMFWKVWLPNTTSKRSTKLVTKIWFPPTPGRRPIAVITNMDKPDAKPKVVRAVLTSCGISHIFEVVNVHKPDHTTLNQKDHETLLNLLERCFTDGSHSYQFRIPKPKVSVFIQWKFLSLICIYRYLTDFASNKLLVDHNACNGLFTHIEPCMLWSGLLTYIDAHWQPVKIELYRVAPTRTDRQCGPNLSKCTDILR